MGGRFCSAARQGHQLGSAAVQGCRLGFAVGSTIGCAWRLPRDSIQAPWLYRARDCAARWGRAAGLAPCLSRATGELHNCLVVVEGLEATVGLQFCSLSQTSHRMCKINILVGEKILDL